MKPVIIGQIITLKHEYEDGEVVSGKFKRVRRGEFELIFGDFGLPVTTPHSEIRSQIPVELLEKLPDDFEEANNEQG